MLFFPPDGSDVADSPRSTFAILDPAHAWDGKPDTRERPASWVARSYARRLTGVARPHLIICDMKVPDGPGLEFIKWLRGQRRGGKTPCIAITGWDNHFPPNAAQGFDAYMRKPIDLDKFCTVAVALAQLWPDGTRTHRGHFLGHTLVMLMLSTSRVSALAVPVRNRRLRVVVVAKT